MTSTFSFIHAADLHLGSPLIGLSLKDEDIARRFAAASREAFSALVSYAIENDIKFLVIAGDTYDGDWKDTSIGLFFNREVGRLHRAGIPVFILKGNHDAESVITKSVRLPESVHTFPADKATTFCLEESKVALHGRSFADRAATENYALSYPPPVPGWFNIGVLHTACDGRPGHDHYAPCSVHDLASRQYQYWALGHVHEHEILSHDPLIVFPGNLQGRSIRECGAKGAVVVHVADGEARAAEHVPFDSARFASIAITIEDIDTESAALTAITAEMAKVSASADGRLLALRLTLQGTTPLHRRLKADLNRIAEDVQALAHHHYEDIWIESLRVETTEPLATTANVDASQLLDLASLLGGLDHDPELLAAAADTIAQITSKLPATIDSDQRTLIGNPALLLDEARSFVLGRLLPPEKL